MKFDYYWFVEIYLDSGVVTKSKWFKVESNVFIKYIFLMVLNVSKDYLFVFQDSYLLANENSSLLIFDRKTFTPIKKIDLNINSYIIKNIFSVNQKYYIFGMHSNVMQALIIDNSLNYISTSKVFNSSRVNSSSNFLSIALYNNMLTIAESGPIRGTQNSAISNIIVHKISLDFESESWETLNSVNGTTFAAGFSSTNLTTGFLFVNSSTANSVFVP